MFHYVDRIIPYMYVCFQIFGTSMMQKHIKTYKIKGVDYDQTSPKPLKEDWSRFRIYPKRVLVSALLSDRSLST